MGNQIETQKWGSKVGFIMAAMGSAVGLGNIWRFPYVLYDNGGGTFLIPYFVAVFTAAIPLLILEYTIGSRNRGASPLSMARIKSGFEWVGWLPTFVAGLIVVYYSSILSWAINYFGLSFTKGWTEDPGGYFFGEFLQLSEGPMDLSGFNVLILVGLVIVWGGAYLLNSRRIDKGIERVNKILLPVMFIIILIIVIRGITLPNAAAGLNALFTPDWGALAQGRVWIAAYGQVFFSMSLAMGIMITYSSYLPKKTEIVNSAFLTGMGNSMFEFTAAIGVFGILGFMAQAQGVGVTEVVSSGVGLAFVAFPTGINMLGAAGPVIGILFFLGLVFAGFTSFISLLEAFSAPFMQKFNVSRKKVYAFSCSIGFAVSLLFATGAGLYILDIMDYFLNNYGLVLVGIFETLALSWFAKIGPFREMANENSYFKVGKWWEVCIRFLIPIILIITLVMTSMSLFQNGYEGYPASALVLFGVVVIVACFVVSFLLKQVKWATPIELSDAE